MKTITRKITRICTAFVLIAGVIAFKGTTYVYAAETPAAETPAAETPTAETISGTGWTLDGAGVFTLTQDIPDDEVGNGLDFWTYKDQIKEIVVAEGVTRIPTAFVGTGGGRQYTNLQKLTLSSTVKSIGIGAFSSCPALTEVHLNEGLEDIGHSAFAGTALFEIHFPSTLKRIGGDAFYDCKNLTSVTIPGNVEETECNAEFYGCLNLEEFIIEEGNLKVFSPVTLASCPNLKYVWIPRTVETIDNTVGFSNACVIGYTGTAAEELVNSEYGTRYGLTFHAIDGDEHSYGDWQTVSEATCTENGLQKQSCTICHAEQTKEIAAAGHTWDEGKVTQEATQQAEGVKTYTCTTCGATQTESIAKVPSSGNQNTRNSGTGSQANRTSPKTGETTDVWAWLLTTGMLAGVVWVLYLKKRAVR